MRHYYTIEGDSYRLRPVRVEDAAFIVELRTNPERNRFIHVTPADVQKQEAWLQEYFERSNDYYFVVENKESGRIEGTVGIYDLDLRDGAAEWGRWVMRPGSRAGIPSMTLTFDFAFDQLGVKSLRSYTAVENERVITILEGFGMQRVSRLPKHLQIGDQAHDAILHRITRDDWKGVEVAVPRGA